MEKLDYFLSLLDEHESIPHALFNTYDIKRGLRNKNGTGVLVGITRVAEVYGYEIEDGKKIPQEGRLLYRGYNLADLVEGASLDNRFSFDEVKYLLLFGNLPSQLELNLFTELLQSNMTLSSDFIDDVFIRSSTSNIMNKLQRAILSLYDYDVQADETSLNHLCSSAINLIAKSPLLLAYSYRSFLSHNTQYQFQIPVLPEALSTAEAILFLLREGKAFSELEAKLLDLCLSVHADHGGGNNSAFTTHVVSSTGTDIYSAIASAIGSLKGPRHGGANIKASKMIAHIAEAIPSLSDTKAIEAYLNKLLDKEAFDHSGLIYGLGHAVYTLSDPRTELLRQRAQDLAKEKGLSERFQFIQSIEKIAGKLIQERKNLSFQPRGNVDLYSAFIYEMLDIEECLFTPLFAISRITGWCAHLIEQVSDEKILRPAYLTLCEKQAYKPIEERQAKNENIYTVK